MRKILIIGLLIGIVTNSFSQKKVLDHQDFDIWNAIKNQKISSDGNAVMYLLEKGEKDSHVKIKNSKGQLILNMKGLKDLFLLIIQKQQYLQ